jgi:hypothetical protein
MDSQLTEMFAHARHMVDEEDRRKQEEQQRRQDAEREALLHDLAQRVDAAFDFSSREKVELDPRMDVLEERGVLEFVVRGVRAIFLLTQKPQGGWMLQVAEDGQPVQSLTELPGGTREDPHSRRLSAARVITAIGDWAMSKEKPGTKRIQPIAQVAKPQQAPRPPANQDPGRRPPPPVPEFGKVFGY